MSQWTRARNLSSWWRLVKWPLVGLFAVTAFVLGYVGFSLFFAAAGDSLSMGDIAYLSLQLFTLESGSVATVDVPWQLETARVLAPATTAAALVAGLIAVFREEINEVRLLRHRGHVVVVGLGSRGMSLVRQLRAASHRVVAIEEDAAHPHLESLRQLRVPVVIGDAREEEVLCRARATRASHVVVVTGSDDVNADVALRAGALAPADRRQALVCMAHVQDPDLCVMLRSEELAAGSAPTYRLDFFNVFDQAARAWQERHAPFPEDGTPVPHVLIVGLNPLGQSLVTESARRWRTRRDWSRRRLLVTVIDPDAASIVAALHGRYPQLEHAADIRIVSARLAGLSRRDLPIEPPPTVIHVCADDDSLSLETALLVRRCYSDLSTSVDFQLTQSLGLAGLLERANTDGVRAFMALDFAMDPESLLGGTYEVLARAIHAGYVRQQQASGVTRTQNSSLVPWDELSDALRESNRDQASHIGVKLQSVGCGIAPLADWDAEDFTFTTGEVEVLAELEHERWVLQRQKDGWKPGPKDVDRKTTLYLVDWSELSEEVKEWDRQAVRNIPVLLARAGYQIVRRPAEMSRVPAAVGGD